MLPVRSAAPEIEAREGGRRWRRAPSGSPCGWRCDSPSSNAGSVGVPPVDAGRCPGRLPLGRRRHGGAARRPCARAPRRHARRPRGGTRRRDRRGAQNGSSGIPMTALVRVTSSAVNGLPCASWVSVWSGDGSPMCERRISRRRLVGLRLGGLERRFERVEVVGDLAEVDDVPAVGSGSASRRRRWSTGWSGRRS